MNQTSAVQLIKETFSEMRRAQQGIPRQEQSEQTAQLLERQVGGSDTASNPHTDQAQGATEAEQAPSAKPAGAGALAGFLVGLALGRRQRSRD
jgi:hypothetical protein